MFVSILAIAVLFIVVAIIVGVSMIWRAYRQKAVSAGDSSLGDYLRAAPRSDQEKRDAVDLALKGLVTCLLGLVFPPLILIGAFLFYYGARKIAYSSMGLGLVDDAEPPVA